MGLEMPENTKITFLGYTSTLTITYVKIGFWNRFQSCSQARKEVIQLKMFAKLMNQNKSITSQLPNSPGIILNLNWEMSTFGGPWFCLPSSRVLGQVQVRQVGSRSRTKKTRCQLNIIFKKSGNISTRKWQNFRRNYFLK